MALGTDTNGSLRVPAALCGVISFKPSFGRLSRAGVSPFVPALYHVGALARSVRDLRLLTEAMDGPDPADPDQDPGPCPSLVAPPVEGLRVAFGAACERPLVAVDGVSFGLHPGEVLAVVGEPRSGRSAMALALRGLVPPEATAQVTPDLARPIVGRLAQDPTIERCVPAAAVTAAFLRADTGAPLLAEEATRFMWPGARDCTAKASDLRQSCGRWGTRADDLDQADGQRQCRTP